VAKVRQVLEPAADVPSGLPRPREEFCYEHLQTWWGAPWHELRNGYMPMLVTRWLCAPGARHTRV